MDLGLDGDVALCTASTSGLGLASATALAENGATVAVCGLTPDHVDRARDQLEAAGDGDVFAARADVTDPDEIEAFVDETADRFGGIDHVVTSAGGPPSGPFLDTVERDWYRAYDLLVMSVVWTVQAAHPYLQDGSGTVTAITSRTVREVADGLVLSNSVRRAVQGLVKTLSREFAPEIRVNCVLPGPFETARMRGLIEADVDRGNVADYDTGYAQRVADVPLDRLGEPRELGDVVAFLASEPASFVNGASLAIDGGALRS